MSVDRNLPKTEPQVKAENPTKCDLIERATIMAEGNGWSQKKAERTVAWLNGCGTWGELMRSCNG